MYLSIDAQEIYLLQRRILRMQDAISDLINQIDNLEKEYEDKDHVIHTAVMGLIDLKGIR